MLLETSVLPYAIEGVAALAVITVVKLFLAAQKEWREDLKGVIERNSRVVEDNTKTHAEAREVMRGCREERERLAEERRRLGRDGITP